MLTVSPSFRATRWRKGILVLEKRWERSEAADEDDDGLEEREDRDGEGE
jgi:hypothetical protein